MAKSSSYRSKELLLGSMSNLRRLGSGYGTRSFILLYSPNPWTKREPAKEAVIGFMVLFPDPWLAPKIREKIAESIFPLFN